MRRLLTLLLSFVLLVPGSALAAGPLFSDGFEGGDLSAWSGSSGTTVQGDVVFAGAWAARAVASSSAAYAYRWLDAPEQELFLDVRFQVVSRSGPMALLRMATASDSAVATLGLNRKGFLYSYNHVTGQTRTSTAGPTNGAWHELQLHLFVNGTSSRIDVWLDESPVGFLSSTDSFGITWIGRVQIGDVNRRTFDAAFDEVVADVAFVAPVPDTPPPSQPSGLTATPVSAHLVQLSWNASTDDVGVEGYTVYRDGAPVATAASTGYADGSVQPSTTYSYTVDAFDAADNHSPLSDPALAETPAASTDPVIAAAGDIACDPKDSAFNGGEGTASRCRQKATSDLLVGAGVDAVLPLGDVQYECAGYSALQQSYDPSWGRVKSITMPAPGNHEYLTTSNSTGTGCSTTSDASGYFTYFGAAAGDAALGYYSFDVGSWHLVSMNSECWKVGGCGAGSPEEQWLRADLEAHPAACTLAYWHKPRFASSSAGNNDKLDAFWRALYDYGAEIVLNGHFHAYERFAPQDPNQAADPDGIREFVVGTGGAELYSFGTIQPNSQVRSNSGFGVLFLTLHDGSYEWTFQPAAGGTFTDSGSGTCH